MRNVMFRAKVVSFVWKLSFLQYKVESIVIKKFDDFCPRNCGTFLHKFYIGKNDYVLQIFFISYIYIFYVFRMFRSSALFKVLTFWFLFSCIFALLHGIMELSKDILRGTNAEQCAAFEEHHRGSSSKSPVSPLSVGRYKTTHSVLTPFTRLHFVYFLPLTSISLFAFR